jgi:glycosyltransferase involved in cell wall biosynthesis
VKILFFVQGLTVAASRLRVLQYLPFLEQAGIGTEVHEFPEGSKGWLNLMPAIEGADVIFVQRKRLPRSALLFLKRLGKKIVFDFDDSVMFKNSLAKNPYSLRRRMSFKRMLKYTDLVIAGNEFLKEEARKYHDRVVVLPTPIDGDRYREKTYPEKGKVRIGWIGDHGSIHYMESYRDVWEELGRKYGSRVELALICDTFIETKEIETVKIPWTLEGEIDGLTSFDIGVMPLFDDLWSKGKCGFKIIQYMGVGAPVVCTPVGINRDVVEDGVNGFWAGSKEEWAAKLSTLVEDAALRERMGREGRKRIVEGYTVSACAPKLIAWMRAL